MEPTVHPIDGVLDLHTFLPHEAADAAAEFIRACHEKGLPRVRIIHGKGTGALRKTIHAMLSRNSLVESFSLAPPEAGGWGATVAILKRKADGQTGPR